MTNKFKKFNSMCYPTRCLKRNSDVSFFENMQEVNCVAFARYTHDEICIQLGFSWDTLKFEQLTGTFTWCYRVDGLHNKELKHCVDLTGPRLTEQNIKLPCFSSAVDIWYSFELFLHRITAMSKDTQTDCQVITEHKISNVVLSGSPTSQGIPVNCQVVPDIKNYDLSTDISYGAMFAPSNQHDAVLLIGEKKLHVNKAFLSYHSTYFRDLFAGKSDEENGIPIEDVSFENFGLLMSIIYPKTAFANDQNAETLLHLGNRFKIPSVMSHVEHHLMIATKLPNERLILLADKYDLQILLEKTIIAIDCVDKAKKFGGSDGYKQLSDSTKAKFSDRLITLLKN